MGLFDRFKRKLPVENNLPDIQYTDMHPAIFKNGLHIERKDHTYIDIVPKLDAAGHQMYKQVYNEAKKQIQNLGIWLVDYKTAGFMEATDTNEDIREIYLEDFITTKHFTSETTKDVNGITLQDFMVNQMLSRESLEQIVEQQEGYAGGIRLDDNIGFINRTYPNIINELRLERKTGISSITRHRNNIARTGTNRSVDISKEM